MSSVSFTSGPLKFIMPPSYVNPIEKATKPINGKTLKSNEIKLEWIPLATSHVAVYITITIISLTYNGISLAHNLGSRPITDENINNDLFSEGALLCSVCVQWLVVFGIFLAGIVVERCIPQPLHMFLSILATNGSAVLFAVNVRRVTDNVIEADSRYFILITMLFGLSAVLCIVYVVMLAQLRRAKRYHRAVVLASTTLQLRKRRMNKLATPSYYNLKYESA